MTTTFVLAVPRIVVGLLMAGHGLQKLAGWFGGSGLQGTADLLGNLHIRGASRWAVALALAETIGGVLMALGFLQPIGQLVVATVLLVAIALVHWPKGLWAANGGIEHPLVLATVALVSRYLASVTSNRRIRIVRRNADRIALVANRPTSQIDKAPITFQAMGMT